MFLKTLSCTAVFAYGVLAVVGLHLPPSNGCPGARLLSLACASASADNKTEKSVLSGTWAKKDGEPKIEFADNNVMKIAPHGDSVLIVFVCDYTVEKDGLVKAKVTGFEGKEEIKKAVAEKLPVGLTFSFKWKAKDDTAKLDDLKGDKIPEMFKTHLEGDFEKK